MNVRTDRYTDRLTDKIHRYHVYVGLAQACHKYVGLAQARPNYTSKYHVPSPSSMIMVSLLY